jgi:hypothetical protein
MYDVLVSLNFGVQLSEDGVNAAETCRSNVIIYFYVSNVRLLCDERIFQSHARDKQCQNVFMFCVRNI